MYNTLFKLASGFSSGTGVIWASKCLPISQDATNPAQLLIFWKRKWEPEK